MSIPRVGLGFLPKRVMGDHKLHDRHVRSMVLKLCDVDALSEKKNKRDYKSNGTNK